MEKMKLVEALSGSSYAVTYKFLIEKFEQDISQFVMWNSPHFVDHGVGHTRRVIEYLDKLIPSEVLRDMSAIEIFVLLAAAVFHDVGMMLDRLDDKQLTPLQIRDMHHVLSRQFVLDNYPLFGIRNTHIAEFVSDVAFCHRRKVTITTVFPSPEPVSLLDGTIRPWRVAALLRLADALDCDIRRAPEIHSDWLSRYYPEDFEHWRACQLVSGVDVNHTSGTVIVDARVKNQADEELLIWKLRDVYGGELEPVVSLLAASHGPRIWNLVGRILRKTTRELREVDIKGYSEEQEEASKVDAEKRSEYFSRLSDLWAGSTSFQQKVARSANLHEEYSRFPFAQSDPCRVAYPIWVYELRYSTNGQCKVINYFEMVNISQEPISSGSYPMSGVVPMSVEQISPRCLDLDMNEECETALVENEPTRKRLRFHFRPIEPKNRRRFQIEHFWSYPLPLFGLRWNRVLVGRFVIDLEARFIFPELCKISQTQVYEEVYPGVNEIGGIEQTSETSTIVFKKHLPKIDSAYNVNILLTKREEDGKV